MIEGLKSIPDSESPAWGEKIGDIVTRAETSHKCGHSVDGSQVCYRIKSHPGTLHANVSYYRGNDRYPHGYVRRIWFEKKEE